MYQLLEVHETTKNQDVFQPDVAQPDVVQPDVASAARNHQLKSRSTADAPVTSTSYQLASEPTAGQPVASTSYQPVSGPTAGQPVARDHQLSLNRDVKKVLIETAEGWWSLGVLAAAGCEIGSVHEVWIKSSSGTFLKKEEGEM
ncbi:aldose 1-epimerase-like [Dorcoceras hygrometricum]|uniref:Aldose 1-epimerase-like n=1 Tax=Dorcoceras hygrometricum TaxID=472368 RepID=A0A2Z7BIV1_9LAMI|nr:aldose 1-epimerase-like [Dorcoceras hygrometricum]